MFRRLLVLLVAVMVASTASGAVILQVDFNSNQDGGGDSTTAGDPGLSVANNHQAGWSSYHANHEAAAEFSTANYGGITVTPAWPNTTDNRVQQSIDRGAGNDGNWDNTAGDLNLVTDWIGIDTRTANGGNGNWDGATGTPTYMTLTIGGLTAGAYEWTSFHHDTEHCHGTFAVWLSIDGGATFTQLPDGLMTDSTAGGNPDSGATEAGPDAYSLPSTYKMSLSANGADDVVLRFAPYSGGAVHRQIWGMNGFELEAVSSDQAYGPSPASGTSDVEKSVVLSWSPADGTATTNGHKIFLSNDFMDVNDGYVGAEVAVLSNPEYDTALLPSALEYGTTYYWRVDQAQTPGGPWTAGAVWSFTVEPYGIVMPGDSIAVTASSSYTGTDPNNTIDGSGLTEDDTHSMEESDMWLSDTTAPGSAWIKYEFDKAYKMHQMLVWNHNTMMELQIGFGIKEAVIEYSVDGDSWDTLGTTHEFAQAEASADYTYNTAVDLTGVTAKYIRITANSNWREVLDQYGLSEVRFSYLPVWARLPEPDSGATGQSVDGITLGWRPGREAASSDLYLSADKMAVINETVDIIGVPPGESHDTGPLDLGEMYYWKVNSVNDTADPAIWPGDLWVFETQEYLVVDDIEDYNNFPPDRVWETWIDGWGNPANGSQIGHLPTQAEIDAGATFVERGIVNSGNQSMPFYYDNTAAASSEATASIANLPIGANWTTNGIKILALSFYGDPNNSGSELMYVKLNGVRVDYSGDMYDLTRSAWTQWNIDLRDFAGVNLSNVTDIAIGFERTGGGSLGVVYFDDLRLYAARCLPSLGKQAADLNSDCIVDLADVDEIASQWLSDGLLVTPQQPGNTGLVSRWDFEGNANDSVGANDATTTGGPTYVAGMTGQGIELDGLNDFVHVEGTFDLPVYTTSLWFRVSGGSGARDLLSAYTSAGTHGILIELQGNGTLRFLHRAPLGTSGGTDIRLSTTHDDGAWHHATLVKSSDTTAAYVNGELASSMPDDTAFGEVLQEIAIGVLMDGNLQRYWAGTIDDVRLYSRALSAGEVAGLAGKTEAFTVPADLNVDGAIDFKDFAVLADSWLDEQLWPQP